MTRPLEARAPANLDKVLACVESVDDYSRLRLAHDFAYQVNITKADCDEAVAFLDAVLKDESLSNADLKGFLNRAMGPGWGMTSPFGANAKAARLHLSAAREAIAVWDGWIS